KEDGHTVADGKCSRALCAHQLSRQDMTVCLCRRGIAAKNQFALAIGAQQENQSSFSQSSAQPKSVCFVNRFLEALYPPAGRQGALRLPSVLYNTPAACSVRTSALTPF